MKIEKVVLITELFDIYQKLLTDKQQNIFKIYFFDDWSFSEIASELNISRAAVSDTIKKIEHKLFYLEDILQINKMRKLIQEINNNANNLSKEEIIYKIKLFKF